MRARVSAAAKSAFAVLLDHHNWKTGRCDPGLDRIVRLAGYSRKATWLGLQQLEAAGIIEIATHGSRSNRNGYRFRWDVIRALDGRAKAALGSGRKRPHKGVENDHLGVVENDQQTRCNKPDEDNPLGISYSSPASPLQGRAGQAERGVPSKQSYLLHGIKGGKAASRREAAEGATERRRQQSINDLPKHERERAWLDAMGERSAEPSR